MAGAGSARRPSSSTATGSPTPRPSTSPRWCWSARSTATSSSAINVHGPLAVGLSGQDAGLHRRRGPLDPSSASSGDVIERRPRPSSSALLADGPHPGHLDHRRPTSPARPTTSTPTTVAGAVAEALGAEKLIFLTDVAGPARRRRRPRQPHRSRSSAAEARALIERRHDLRRHDPEDRRLPPGDRARRRLGPPGRRPGAPRRCCSSCSPTPASARW